MSIIIAYAHDGVTHFATTTRFVIDGIKHTETAESNFKIKKLSNGLLVGAADDMKLSQMVLARAEDIFTLTRSGNLTKEHVIRCVLPKLFAFIKRNGLLDQKAFSKSALVLDGDIIMAHGGTILHIQKESMCVNRYTKYVAIGNSDCFATGALAQVDTSKDIDAQLVDILRAASTVSEKIAAPYLTINTRDMKYCLED